MCVALLSAAWVAEPCQAAAQGMERLPADVDAVSSVAAALARAAGPVTKVAMDMEARMSQLEHTVAGMWPSVSPCLQPCTGHAWLMRCSLLTKRSGLS